MIGWRLTVANIEYHCQPLKIKTPKKLNILAAVLAKKRNINTKKYQIPRYVNPLFFYMIALVSIYVLGRPNDLNVQLIGQGRKCCEKPIAGKTFIPSIV